MAARKSKARSPARGKAKSAGKGKGVSSRAASARSSRSSAAKKSRGGAAKSAQSKSTARKSAAARKAPTRKTAARVTAARKTAPKITAKRAAPKRAAPKRVAPQRTISRRPAPRRTPAPRREAAPPPPPPMESPAVTEATEVPPAPAAVPEAAGEPGSGLDGEGGEEDEPRRRGGRREAVASFPNRDKFRTTVKRLLAAGFKPTDLSILASHDSLEVAGGVPGYTGKPGQSLLAGLTDEVELIAPLQVAGFSILGGGPIAGAVAAAITVGLSSLGLGEVIDRLVSNRHVGNYEAALRAGNLLLWVRVASAAQEWRALAILGDGGGANAHVVERAESATART